MTTQLSGRPSRGRVPAAGQRGPSGLEVLAVGLICTMILASVFITGGGRVAAVDLVQLLAGGIAALLLGKQVADPYGLNRRIVRVSAVFYAYVLVATCYTVFGHGDSFQLLVDAFSFTYLLVALVLLRERRPRRPVILLCVSAVSLLFSASVILDASPRPAGLMENPNMSATWLGGAIVLLVSTCPWRSLLVLPAVPVAFYAMVLTQSYSAVLALAVAVAYLTLFSTRRTTVRALAVTGLVVVALAWRQILAEFPGSSRLDRSSQSRTYIWTTAIHAWWAHPFGIGYGNFVDSKLVNNGQQTHNDLIGALVEMGPLGVIALVAIFVMIWVVGGRATRASLLFFATNCLFHNCLNFRHLWIFLAIAIFYDACTATQGTGQRQPEQAAGP